MRFVRASGTSGCGFSKIIRATSGLEHALSDIGADSGCGRSSFVEDQPLEVVGEVRQADIRTGPRKADLSHAQPHAFFLVGEDALSRRTAPTSTRSRWPSPSSRPVSAKLLRAPLETFTPTECRSYFQAAGYDRT